MLVYQRVNENGFMTIPQKRKNLHVFSVAMLEFASNLGECHTQCMAICDSKDYDKQWNVFGSQHLRQVYIWEG